MLANSSTGSRSVDGCSPLQNDAWPAFQVSSSDVCMSNVSRLNLYTAYEHSERVIIIGLLSDVIAVRGGGGAFI